MGTCSCLFPSRSFQADPQVNSHSSAIGRLGLNVAQPGGQGERAGLRSGFGSGGPSVHFGGSGGVEGIDSGASVEGAGGGSAATGGVAGASGGAVAGAGVPNRASNRASGATDPTDPTVVSIYFLTLWGEIMGTPSRAK